MLRLLLDANLSPETAAFLRQQFSFDVTSLLEQQQAGLSDGEIVNLAKEQKRIIVTLDRDFGELYHQLYHQKKNPSAFGVIILHLRDQRIEQVNKILGQFFQSPPGEKLFKKHPESLAVITEATVRILP